MTDCLPVDDGSTGHYRRHVVEFHLVALPSGIAAHQDLLRLAIYDQHHQVGPFSGLTTVVTFTFHFNVRKLADNMQPTYG